MKTTIRIGTRDSELALWQAKTVQKQLQQLGFATELLPVKSKGDLVLDKPLYEFGITGIFTKTLDVALLNGDIDIAVHSMKDVPTALPKGVVEAAVLPRENPADLLLHKGASFLKDNSSATIATGSLRRKAQWLSKYPNHQVVNLRGNVNTRLQKLANNAWQGAVFAAAGLQRINLKPEDALSLDWMIPAPAQGCMLVVTKEENDFCRKALAKLNDEASRIAAHIERDFLRTLEGGCTAPIGALAVIEGEQVSFKGGLFSLDGTQKFLEETIFPVTKYKDAGKTAAKCILERGGHELMQQIKAETQKA